MKPAKLEPVRCIQCGALASVIIVTVNLAGSMDYKIGCSDECPHSYETPWHVAERDAIADWNKRNAKGAE